MLPRQLGPAVMGLIGSTYCHGSGLFRWESEHQRYRKTHEAVQVWLPEWLPARSHMASRTEYIGPQSIADLRPGDMLWDAQLKRFGARCRARATTYFIKARIDGRQRWITLGRHGPLTPAGARAQAKLMLAEIDNGRDPTREEKARSTSYCRDHSTNQLSAPTFWKCGPLRPNAIATIPFRSARLLFTSAGLWAHRRTTEK